MIGFGRTDQALETDEDDSKPWNSSGSLKETFVTVLTNAECTKRYAGTDSKIPASVMCAYGPNTDACQVELIYIFLVCIYIYMFNKNC